MDDISKRLSFARKNLGLTYKDLGEMVGITESGMRLSIKRNNIKEYYINIISDKTGINKDWLVSGEGEMMKSKNETVYDFNSELNVPFLLQYLLDNNDKLLKDESFRNYIRMNMEYIMTDDEREAKLDALEKLKKLVREKHSKKN